MIKITCIQVVIVNHVRTTLAGLSYHICGKLEVALIASPSSQHQHCTDEAQKAETVLSAVSPEHKLYNYYHHHLGEH